MHYKNIRRSKALIIYYRLKAEGQGKCIIDIKAIIERVKKQKRGALIPLSIIIK